MARWLSPSGVQAPSMPPGPQHFLNGGILATLPDCHGVCTAIGGASQKGARDIGSDSEICEATTSLSFEYQHPVPINSTVHLCARLVALEIG